MKITIKRIREVRRLERVRSIVAWNFVHELKAIAEERKNNPQPPTP